MEISKKQQVVFYGAPGTGKSYAISKMIGNEDVVRTTFHPDTDYSTFVGVYKPSTTYLPIRDFTGKVILDYGKEVTVPQIVYEFVPQSFTMAYIDAWKKIAESTGNEPKTQFLIIEEINRGNCAQIFGDLFQLLDRNVEGFSEYPIKTDTDMKNHLFKSFKDIQISDSHRRAINSLYNNRDVVSEVLSGDILLLPSNLFIWATMNTSDQSLFPIDSAFKRRWDWYYIPISNGKKDWVIAVGRKYYDWWSFLQKINEQIDNTTNSEDKKLGYFFCKADNRKIDVETFVGKVVFYLLNDVFKDFVEEVDFLKDKDESSLTFNKFYSTDDGRNIEIAEEKVDLFLTNLGVEEGEYKEDEEEEEEEKEEEEESEGNESEKPWVKLNGKRYCENTVISTFVKIIEEIGVDRVAGLGLIANEKGKIKLLNTEKLSVDIPGGYALNQRKIGDYWLMVKYPNSKKLKLLKKMKDGLGLDMEFDEKQWKDKRPIHK